MIQMADEYISREFMLKNLEADKMNNAEHCDPVTVQIMERFIKYVKEFPAADVQPTNQWISVDEKLPKTGESVLAYVAINKNLKGFGECKPEIRIGWLDDGGKWALQFSNMDYSEVLCWLPLPELPQD